MQILQLISEIKVNRQKNKEIEGEKPSPSYDNTSQLTPKKQ